MSFLIDTSVLARLADVADPKFALSDHAIVELHRRGERLHVTPQNLVEFRSVATRPRAVNGLGLSPADAESRAARFEAIFPILPDTPDIFLRWKSLVATAGVMGKQVHDARLVAVCHTHGITHLLTFNLAHFVPLSGVSPGIVVVDPATI